MCTIKYSTVIGHTWTLVHPVLEQISVGQINTYCLRLSNSQHTVQNANRLDAAPILSSPANMAYACVPGRVFYFIFTVPNLSQLNGFYIKSKNIIHKACCKYY